jgi:energy-coupling factor transporter ATP-binding protein EcfA2
MKLKLSRFRVTDFRSVKDSGWIGAEDVTALIGTNESGKTNLLLPLWKLNPAKEGGIDLTDDYPRKHFVVMRKADPQPDFIDAVFEVPDEIAQRLSEMTGTAAEDLREVSVKRDFGGEYSVSFPHASAPRTVPGDRVRRIADEALAEINNLSALKKEGDLKDRVVAAVNEGRTTIPEGTTSELDVAQLEAIGAALAKIEFDAEASTSTIRPRFERLKSEVEALKAELMLPLAADAEGVFTVVIDSLPKFVYYSNYGNLDSEIYLPHVIENLSRTDLGARETAKARTLKVLFEFVGLSPAEILELGRDFRIEQQGRQPTAAEIEQIAEKKRQRSILLQSASSLLTDRFRDWWKQGEYRFRFEADGDHFRIWVADDKRPEEIELEQRSTGLQWFLSFYLVFLVESRDEHDQAVLLLDEPGLSLHPLAQRDLSRFFDGLAETNQLVYTTHSPFLVDADHLDRVRRVFVGADGTTRASAELRGVDTEAGQRGSGYAVHAALNLTVAESLLLGCEPVIVEGPSDQHYLTAIKLLLTAAGSLKLGRELVFPPAGGVKGVKPVATLLLGRDEALPVVFVDSDQAGKTFASGLRTGMYQGAKDRVLEVGQYVKLTDAEIEDMIPTDVLIREVDRLFRAEGLFADVYKTGAAIVPQIEAWAATQSIALPPSWKVDLAVRVKRVLLNAGFAAVDETMLTLWEGVFSAFSRTTPATAPATTTTK